MSEERKASYENMVRLIVLQRMDDTRRGKDTAALHAAMLSLLDKKDAKGEECPGWVALENEAHQLLK